MLDKFWDHVKSGSDIRGTAMASESTKTPELTNEIFEKIMLAFAQWISEKTGLDYCDITIAIGHDSRLSATRIKNVCINTLRGVGINIYDCSLCSTPAMYMATSVLTCSAAIEITASHHPWDRNGLKFFTAEGGITPGDVEEILLKAQNNQSPPPTQKGNVRAINLMEYYQEKIKKMICDNIQNVDNKQRPLVGTKIVIDAGNGAGGFFAKNILEPLGADTEGSSYLDPDGNFPNHVPNPENTEALESIVRITKNANADLGIIFDTDVDRVAVVDKDGTLISSEKMIALASRIALKDNPDSIIVTDSVTSDHLKEFIGKYNGTQFRYKRGYNNVITMAKKINTKGMNCPLAIESSGHAAFKENKFIDDGAYLAAKIIVEMVNLKSEGKTLKDVLKNLKTAKEQVTIRIPINSEDTDKDSTKILNYLKNHAHSNRDMECDQENIEGVRINVIKKQNKGWFIIRKSVHDPELVLHAEAEVAGGLKNIINSIKSSLKHFHELDISKL